MQRRKVGPVTVPVDPENHRPLAERSDDPARLAEPARLADIRRQQQAYWPLPCLRAIPAAVVALVITFSADHSANFGLPVFALFAVASGGVILLALRRRSGDARARRILQAQAAVSVLAGVTAFALRSGGVSALVLTVAVWATLTGALELYDGLRMRRRHPASGDGITTGGLTLLLAVVYVALPRDYAEAFTGPDGVARVLDASIIAVGILGAYSAIIAVHLLVAGLSAKWGTSIRPDAPSAGISIDAAKGDPS